MMKNEIHHLKVCKKHDIEIQCFCSWATYKHHAHYNGFDYLFVIDVQLNHETVLNLTCKNMDFCHIKYTKKDINRLVDSSDNLNEQQKDFIKSTVIDLTTFLSDENTMRQLKVKFFGM